MSSIAELSRNVEKLRFMAKAKEADERKKNDPLAQSDSRWVCIPELADFSMPTPPKVEPLKGKHITPRRSFGGINPFLEQRAATKSK